jgi:hypothetical protein
MSQQNSATPWDFLQKVESHFGIQFGFDIACTRQDAKASDGYYFDEGVDALQQDWTTINAEYSWLNPPWKQIGKFAKKCAELKSFEATDNGDGVIFTPNTNIWSLWNAGICSSWFLNYVWDNAAVYLVQPRITFLDPRTGNPFVNSKGRLQTGLNDIILCDWSGIPRTIQPFRWK